MRYRVLAASVLGLAAGALALAQAPPLSGEFQANTEVTAAQYFSDVGMDATGNFVVVWESYQSGDADVYARRYDANGNALGPDFRVNTYTTDYQGIPAVAMRPTGEFMVAWGSFDQNETNGTNVYAQRYDASGNPAGGEFLVNTYTTGYQYGPAIAASTSGNFVVVWSDYGQDGDAGGVYGKVFDATGSPVSGEFQVNQFTTGYQWLPKVAYGGNGDFVVAWESENQDGAGYAVMARRFGSDGTPRANEFQVNQNTAGNQSNVAVAADAAGDFVVTWTSESQDGSLGGIFARRFGSAGQPLGAEFQVNTYTSGIQDYPRVGMDAKGNFTVTWSSYLQDGSDMGVFAQRFDGKGQKVGAEFQVNETTSNSQELPAVAVGANGRAVICWDTNVSPSDFDVFARMTAPLPQFLQVDVQFSHPGGSQAPAAAALNGVFEPGETVIVAPGWNNDTPSDLTLTGTASNFTGPPGANYTIAQNAADYGTIPSGQIRPCSAPAGCYSMQVDDPATRPAQHWDATFDEDLSVGGTQHWTLHIGESFPDVPDTQIFYKFIETLFHNGVTGGCAGGGYCPDNNVTRAQMAVFLLKAKHGSSFVPPSCTGVFPDVACPSQFADWIEELFHEAITGGCGNGNYCPDSSVTRQQMAVFLLKAEHGSTYTPPQCQGIFGDVTCPSQFADWIEQLAAEQITGGCGNNNYCPTNPNTRGQMAVFLVKTFGLALYGP
jgi:hypothetical protein